MNASPVLSEWNRSFFHRGFGMLASIGLLALFSSSQAAPLAHELLAAHAYQLPLTFEINQGQADARVDFLARGPGYDIFLTATEAVFALPRGPDSRGLRPVMRMQLVGSAADPRVQGVDALPGKVNYFRGKDAVRWQTKVPTYQRAKYSAVYPGVDLVYYGQAQQLEYDFIVAPGADPGRIKLRFGGVEKTTVDAQGDLVLDMTSGAPLRFRKPAIYQLRDGRRQLIEGGYVQRGSRQIGFQVAAYDRTRPLIIDPVLNYSTYLGGSGAEHESGIAVDATGAVYVSGFTTSTDFPTANALQPARKGSFDLYVAKLSPDGTTLVYATYLGGSEDDTGGDVAVDSAGAAYVIGSSLSADFPTVNALQPAKSGDRDAVVTKLSADGSQLIYSTYFGGRSYESGAGIAVDSAGATYIAGGTGSTDFPTVNPVQPWPGFECTDAFVTKLVPDGSAVSYSTYIGGSLCEEAADIAVDSLGSAYVTGWTETVGFPLVNPLPVVPESSFHAFVFKLTPDGTQLIYSTPFGGEDYDSGNAIAVDASGAAYVTGTTYSSRFPTMNALQPQLKGSGDAFVLKMAPEGGALIYSTYLGGSRDDGGSSITVDTAGAVYITGTTDSPDFPTMNPIQQMPGGSRDAFISKLSPNGASLVHSTYLGGMEEDRGTAIAVDLTGGTYVAGFTKSRDFPTMNALQSVLGGTAVCSTLESDAFVLKIMENSLASPAAEATILASPAHENAVTRTEVSRGGGAMDVLFLAALALMAVSRAAHRADDHLRRDRRHAVTSSLRNFGLMVGRPSLRTSCRCAGFIIGRCMRVGSTCGCWMREVPAGTSAP